MRQVLKIGLLFILCNLAFIILTSAAHADFQFSPDSTSITPDTEINVQVDLSLQGQANKNYFLEGAFKKVDGSNYFGLTQKDGNWVTYTSSNFSTLPEVTTDDQGTWHGTLKIKLDTASSNFNGNGNYVLQIKRFTEGGSSSFSDNQVQVAVSGSVASPAPSASSGPTASSSPDASLDSNDGKLHFTFSAAPSSVNSDQTFSVSVVLSNDKPNQELYLKGAFFKDGSTNYFGKTQINGTLVKNSASYSDQQKITTDSGGNWSGSLTVMPDDSDSGFTGSGNYKFKIAKYTSSGSGPTWTDSVTITINYIATPAPSSNPTATPKPSASGIVLGTSRGTSSIDDGSSHVLLTDAGGLATIPDLESTNSATPPAAVNLKMDPPTAGFYNWWYIGLGLVTLLGSIIPLVKSGKLGELSILRGVQLKRWNL